MTFFFLTRFVCENKGGIPSEIGELPQLEIMYLGDNPLGGSIPSTIFNNSMLQDIELGSSNLSGSLPSNLCQGLPNIQILYLGFNQLSGKLPYMWNECKVLTDVELSQNRFGRGSNTEWTKNEVKTTVIICRCPIKNV